MPNLSGLPGSKAKSVGTVAPSPNSPSSAEVATAGQLADLAFADHAEAFALVEFAGQSRDFPDNGAVGKIFDGLSAPFHGRVGVVLVFFQPGNGVSLQFVEAIRFHRIRQGAGFNHLLIGSDGAQDVFVFLRAKGFAASQMSHLIDVPVQGALDYRRAGHLYDRRGGPGEKRGRRIFFGKKGAVGVSGFGRGARLGRLGFFHVRRFSGKTTGSSNIPKP